MSIPTALDLPLYEASPPPLMAQVGAAIEAQLAHGALSLPAIARALGTSERTLQRHLACQGCSFRDAVEEVRARLARGYLDNASTSLGDIALRLGYAEVSAFLRAFKRWTGMTPTQFRHRAPG